MDKILFDWQFRYSLSALSFSLLDLGLFVERPLNVLYDIRGQRGE